MERGSHLLIAELGALQVFLEERVVTLCSRIHQRRMRTFNLRAHLVGNRRVGRSTAFVERVHSVVDEIEDRLRKAGAKPVRREGEREGRWVLLDYVDIVVHVQHAEERVYYALERLWKDCPVIPTPEPVGAVGAGGSAAEHPQSGPSDRGQR